MTLTNIILNHKSQTHILSISIYIQCNSEQHNAYCQTLEYWSSSWNSTSRLVCSKFLLFFYLSADNIHTCEFVKIHQIIHILWVHFSVCMLYFNMIFTKRGVPNLTEISKDILTSRVANYKNLNNGIRKNTLPYPAFPLISHLLLPLSSPLPLSLICTQTPLPMSHLS